MKDDAVCSLFLGVDSRRMAVDETFRGRGARCYVAAQEKCGRPRLLIVRMY